MKVVNKLFLLVAAGLLLTLSVFGYLSYQREVGQYVADMKRDARLLGGALSAGVSEVWRAGGEDRAMGLIAQANRAGGLLEVRWVWPSSMAGDVHRPRVPVNKLSSLRQGITVTIRGQDEATGPVLYTYLPVTTPDGRLGAVELAESLAPLSEFARRGAHRLVALTCMLVAVGGLLLAVAGQRLVGKPIRELVEQAGRIGVGDFETPKRRRGRDELAALAAAMDHMAGQLEEARERSIRDGNERLKTLEQLRQT